MPLGAHKATMMGTAGVSAGADVVLLTTNNITSGVANSAFTSLLTSTYKEYVFGIYALHPATDEVSLTFNGSTDGGSNYNVTKTTCYTNSYHDVAGSYAYIEYDTGKDLAQSTAYQIINNNCGNANDEQCVGELHLFNPASTTFAKLWYYQGQTTHAAPAARADYVCGYFNTTSAIDAVDFKFSSGNIDLGKIKMWGVK